MAQVKVWNDNKFPHTESFKGETITIPPGGFIEMDYLEACDFAGQFTPMKKQADGSADPRTFKMIRVEAPAEQLLHDVNVVHATGQRAASAEDIAKLTQAFAAMNPDRLVSDKALDTVEIKKTDLDNMLARIAALESSAEKRGPGRPKKEA